MIILKIILILIGLFSILLTLFNFPGQWLFFIAIATYAIFTGFEIIEPAVLVGYLLATSFISLIDFLAATFGAKKYGASKWGIAGSFLGGFLGLLLFSFPGLLVGTLLGTAVFEYQFAKKDINSALKSGLGSFIGLLFGIVLKTFTLITLFVVFVTQIF